MSKPRKSEKLARHLEDQGCQVRRTVSGYLVLHPNGIDRIVWHDSLDDRGRSLQNLKSMILRTGLTFPKGIL